MTFESSIDHSRMWETFVLSWRYKKYIEIGIKLNGHSCAQTISFMEVTF